MVSNQANVIASAQALDGWLRANLGRRLTLALARPLPTAHEAWQALQTEIDHCQEVRLLALDALHGGADGVSAVSQRQSSSWEQVMRQALQQDVDALLIWYEAGAADAPTANNSADQLRKITQAADALNAFDHITLALIGPGMTRTTARALGFEDGFPLDDATAQADTLAALVTLARVTLDAEAYRRRGSSPPCYL